MTWWKAASGAVLIVAVAGCSASSDSGAEPNVEIESRVSVCQVTSGELCSSVAASNAHLVASQGSSIVRAELDTAGQIRLRLSPGLWDVSIQLDGVQEAAKGQLDVPATGGVGVTIDFPGKLDGTSAAP